MHFDLGSCVIDVTKVVGRQGNVKRPDVLLQPMQLRSTGDWDDPRLLGHDPLLFTTAEFGRPMSRAMLQPHLPKGLERSCLAFTPVDTLQSGKNEDGLAEFFSQTRPWIGNCAIRRATRK